MSGAAASPRGASAPARSIRLRLTLWYAGSILILLLGGTVAARTLVHSSLEREFARSLDASLGLVQGFFRVEIAEYRQIEPTLAHIAGELVIPDRRIAFVRPDGASFVSPVASRAAPLPALEEPIHSAVAPLDPELAPRWSVRVEASHAALERQLGNVDRAALLAVPLAFVLAFLTGWILTGRTLHPVALMADAADRITAGAGGRIPVAVPDDELGRLGLRFNALLDRLDDALARQRRFLADAAHELRTPIARARGTAELALGDPSTSGDREALSRTQQELESMSRLVDELLELARADSTAGPAPLAIVYLDDLVTEAARAFAALAAQRSLRVSIEVDEEVPVQGDAVALQRLLGILVDNAIRYSRPGGVVRIAARRTAGVPELLVEDSGIGIPPHEQERIFERFFRGAEARRVAPEGSGLGLAIAQLIAQRFGLDVRITSASPSGTCVLVSFRGAATN